MTPEELTAELERHPYRFATSMPDIPHFYTLRKNWDDDRRFIEVVLAIRAMGVSREWRDLKAKPYWEASGWRYWTMGDPVETTTLINRERIESL